MLQTPPSETRSFVKSLVLNLMLMLMYYLRKARKLSLATGPSSPHSVYTSWVTLRLVARQRTCTNRLDYRQKCVSVFLILTWYVFCVYGHTTFILSTGLPYYLEGSHSKVEQLLLPLQLQLELSNKLAAVKEQVTFPDKLTNWSNKGKLLSLSYLENRDSSSLAAEGRMETMRSTCANPRFLLWPWWRLQRM